MILSYKWKNTKFAFCWGKKQNWKIQFFILVEKKNNLKKQNLKKTNFIFSTKHFHNIFSKKIFSIYQMHLINFFYFETYSNKFFFPHSYIWWISIFFLVKAPLFFAKKCPVSIWSMFLSNFNANILETSRILRIYQKWNHFSSVCLFFTKKNKQLILKTKKKG